MNVSFTSVKYLTGLIERPIIIFIMDEKLKDLLKQEKDLQFMSFTSEDALNIRNLLIKKAKKNNLNINQKKS